MWLLIYRQAATVGVGLPVSAAARAAGFSGGRVQQVWHAAAGVAHSRLWHDMVSLLGAMWGCEAGLLRV